MHQHEGNQGWATEDGTIQPAAADAEGVGAEAEVLARVPDLNTSQADRQVNAKPARSDGRILSQGLSVKLLAGGAILLILAAIVPYVLSKGKSTDDRHPAPNAGLAPPFTGATTQNPSGSPTTPGTPPRPQKMQPAPPGMSFNQKIPGGPPFSTARQGPGKQANKPPRGPAKQGNVVPKGPGKQANRGLKGPGNNRSIPAARQAQDPNWRPPPQQPAGRWQAPHVADRPRNPAWDSRGQAPAAGQPGPAPVRSQRPQTPPYQTSPYGTPPADARGSAVPNASQPPVRYEGRYEANRANSGYYQNYPAPRTNAAQPQTNPNRSMMIPGRSPAPTGGSQANYRQNAPADSWQYYRRDYQADPRAGYQRDYQARYQPSYQADSRADPRYGYPPRPAGPPQPANPGVARFEGIIAKPPVRTTNDPARPGIY